MSSPDSTTDEVVEETTEVSDQLVVDQLRNELVASIETLLGNNCLDSHVEPGVDVWIRVTQSAWFETAEIIRDKCGMSYFNFLSAIDWKPSPYGRDMDAAIDVSTKDEILENHEMEWGITGGEERFQLLARFHNPVSHLGIHVKTDLVGDSPEVETLIPIYPGADWHEREVAEMFGISFKGHPNLVNLYLPTGFEGNPLRKDFPLLARRVKPWPGIVDVELMPGQEDDENKDSGEEVNE